MKDDETMAGKRSTEASVTVAILREIRDAARETNARLDQTNARLDDTNARLDQTNARLDSLQTELNRGFDSLRTEMHQGFDLLGRRIDNLRLGEHRREHEALRGRVERIEQHLGLRTG